MCTRRIPRRGRTHLKQVIVDCTVVRGAKTRGQVYFETQENLQSTPLHVLLVGERERDKERERERERERESLKRRKTFLFDLVAKHVHISINSDNVRVTSHLSLTGQKVRFQTTFA